MATRRTDEDFIQDLTRLLCSEGVSSLTIGEIAQRMRCSRRRLYEIAPTKEALFVGICRDVLAANLERGFAAARRESDAARAVSAYLHAALNTSGLSKAALADLDAIDSGRAVFDAYQLARVRGLESLLEAGMRQGLMAPHNPRLVSEAILGAAHRLRSQQFLKDTGMKMGDAFSEFYEIILNGLLCRPDADGPTQATCRSCPPQ
ncbi:TetR/AcrR family transcriptional regulator [Cupriavidus sp. WGlv3]|uniref:TetR/AcrR family transcriptional regulator n=1 Tax=Cupriavidus sp. WGlv3 TaxID=2919924 RepID=UPI002090D730|nr:TetR/AcrR family transcriptional regulator [Cupriavidus sp. WGlv3]MCO4863166.1 TetR/AcrR family transcriptional regulator [Cupriavidus sp. WGlv3]